MSDPRYPNHNSFEEFLHFRMPEYRYGDMKTLNSSGSTSGATETWMEAAKCGVRLAQNPLDPKSPMISGMIDKFNKYMETAGRDVPFSFQEVATSAVIPRGERDVSDQFMTSCLVPIQNFVRKANWVEYFRQKYRINEEYKTRNILEFEYTPQRGTPGLPPRLQKKDTTGKPIPIPTIFCDLGFSLSAHKEKPSFAPGTTNYTSPSLYVHADKTWDSETLFTHLISLFTYECKQYRLFDWETWLQVVACKNIVAYQGTGTAGRRSKQASQEVEKDHGPAATKASRQTLHYGGGYGSYFYSFGDYYNLVVTFLPEQECRFDDDRILESIADGVAGVEAAWIHITEFGERASELTTRFMVAVLIFHKMDLVFMRLARNLPKLPAPPREQPKREKPGQGGAAEQGPAAAAAEGQAIAAAEGQAVPAAEGQAVPAADGQAVAAAEGQAAATVGEQPPAAAAEEQGTGAAQEQTVAAAKKKNDHLSPVVEGSEPGSARPADWPSPSARPDDDGPPVVSPGGLLPAAGPQRPAPNLSAPPPVYPGRVSTPADTQQPARRSDRGATVKNTAKSQEKKSQEQRPRSSSRTRPPSNTQSSSSGGGRSASAVGGGSGASAVGGESGAGRGAPGGRGRGGSGGRGRGNGGSAPQ